MIRSPELPMDIMLDIETMGIKPGSMILSIAAAPFYYDRSIGVIPDYYEKISVDDSQRQGFTCDPATTVWWNAQDEEVKREAISGTKSVSTVLTEFSNYIHSLPKGIRVWGNGASFDNILIREAYSSMKLVCPFNFRQDMCYRTLKNLFPFLATSKPTTAHDALSDAKAQAENADRILSFMFQRQ